MTPGVKPLIAGNWKMNGTRQSLGELLGMAGGFDAEMQKRLDMLVCVPATLMSDAVAAVKSTPMAIGGQDCHSMASGAHTGDISALMLADCGARAVIVGHSERRTDHGETSEMVREKADAALSANLMPVICIGETGEERKNGQTLEVLGEQLAGSLTDSAAIVIAYEPVWAIGTGLVPTTADVAEAHAFIREQLAARYGEAGSTIRILYGGSVKPSNAAELLAVANVDGALVGGASLKAGDFLGICKACG
ncbi:MAG: triose-phosphate isomerase [Nitratireductor sp.]